MIRIAAFALAFAVVSCKHDKSPSSPAAGSEAAKSTGATAASDMETAAQPGDPGKSLTRGGSGVADGVRTISVQATADGYSPAKIAGKPNEKLMLVFTRTVDSSCMAQLKTPSGKVVDLPLNQPVKVAVTVPASGEVGFACGMDMYQGIVVAQ
jgi:hypothetical protein